MDTKTDLNLNNIIATLPLISISSVKKIHQQMSSNLISTLLDESQSEDQCSELGGLDITISARYDWSIASQSTSYPLQYVIGISGILPYNRNVTLQTFLLITQDFVCLHSIFAQLYINAAASPASCVC